MMTLAQAHALLPASLLVGDGHIEFTRVHSDSRSLQAGDFFVALRGEHFDGHDFLAQAKAAGAVAALAEAGLAEAGLAGLQVKDSLAALQELAAAWRHRLHLPLALVAGSNGKTTVTQMVASILHAWLGDCALATRGNFNNHIGLPLTLLRLRQDDVHWHRVAVLEVGMNQPGEIARLAAIAAPTVVLVNNAQREHQEFMHSVEAVARENGAAISMLGASGTVVIPADDAYTPLWRELAGARQVIDFALEPVRAPAAVHGTALWAGEHWAIALHTPQGEAALALTMPGRHNAKNALAAAATALALGAPLSAVVQGVADFRAVRGRSALHRLRRAGRAFTLVDDSYNANPDSVAAAIDVLATLPAPRWLVLGDMGEVGSQGPQFHADAGALARAKGIEHLWCAGNLSVSTAQAYGPGARHFADAPALIAALSQAPDAASLLIKGSRFMGMPRVVDAVMKDTDAA
jgi:UDP-N-acetylmuramoyl-tripeptide--D-alanyl-D-alanine ligase